MAVTAPSGLPTRLPRDAAGATPLLIAAEGGFTRVCELLLERGARMDERDGKGHTALMAATAGRHLETGGVLVAAGVGQSFLDAPGGVGVIVPWLYFGLCANWDLYLWERRGNQWWWGTS